MADYVAKVLQVAPSNWTQAAYTSNNYVTIELENYSQEYNNIVIALSSKANSNLDERIRKVDRIQHPFAYGRFVLRKEQLEKRDGLKRVPTRYFLQVKENDVKEALAYNMDARRTAFTCANRRTDGSKCIVVVQSIGAPSNWQRDCESYPEYVVYYNNDGLQNQVYRESTSYYDDDYLDDIYDDYVYSENYYGNDDDCYYDSDYAYDYD